MPQYNVQTSALYAHLDTLKELAPTEVLDNVRPGAYRGYLLQCCVTVPRVVTVV